MKKFWETEWFDIQFSDVAELSSTNIADSTFYTKFYEHFYRKYQSFEDLPKSWRLTKGDTAKQLFKLLNGRKKILSIGCGIGYIELQLSEMFGKQVELLALDPSISATQWINQSKSNIKLIHGTFPEAVEGKQFDAAYACVIDYCFDNQQYLSFLKSIKDFGIKEFILTVSTHSCNWKGKIYKTAHSFIKWILCILGLRKKRELGQFWGYFRSINEHLRMLRNAGFTKFECGTMPHGEQWIRCLV